MTRDASAGSSPPSSSLPDIACFPRITELFKLKQGFGDCVVQSVIQRLSA